MNDGPKSDKIQSFGLVLLKFWTLSSNIPNATQHIGNYACFCLHVKNYGGATLIGSVRKVQVPPLVQLLALSA
jgi:hypothetical protein